MAPEQLDRISLSEVDRRTIQDTLPLANSYFPEGHPARSAGYLEWLYIENPFGRAKAVLAKLNGDVTAMMVLVPLRFWCGEWLHEAHFVVNVLSHPNHRDRNLFVKLIRHAMATLPRETWLLGHPNAAARPGWTRTKMRFREPYELRLLLPSMTLAARRGVIRNCREDRLSALDFSRISEQQRRSPVPLIAVSPQYLGWRFLRHPRNRYRLDVQSNGDVAHSYCVHKYVKPGVGMLVDWRADEHGTLLRPALLGGATLAPVSLGGGAGGPLRKASLPINILKKRYEFFSTPLSSEVSNIVDWGAFTFAATDFA